MSYRVPQVPQRVIQTIKRSRFIASVSHTPTPDAAREFIESVRSEFPDATHHCWAYNLGPPGDSLQTGMSDDGEPRGTAGRPMLLTLLHSGIGEIAVVVTRYFGGVKLGTGGLVRAYGGMVKQVIATLPLADKYIPQGLVFRVAYADIPAIEHTAAVCGVKIIAVDYAAAAVFRIEVAAEKAAAFRAAAVEATRGRIRFEGPTPCRRGLGP